MTSNLKDKHEEIDRKMKRLFEDLDLMCRFRLSSNNFENLQIQPKKASDHDKVVEAENSVPIASVMNPDLLRPLPQDLSKPDKFSTQSSNPLSDAEKLRNRMRRIKKMSIKAKNNERIRKIKERNPTMPMKTVKENIKMHKGRYFTKKSPNNRSTKITSTFSKQV